MERKIYSIRLTDEILAKARIDTRHNSVYENSVCNGASMKYAILAEIVWSLAINRPIENAFNYDFKNFFRGDWVTQDVKANKSWKSVWKQNWLVTGQPKSDLLIFVNINSKTMEALIFGYLWAVDFYRVAERIKKGDPIPDAKFLAKGDCYLVRADQMKTFEMTDFLNRQVNMRTITLFSNERIYNERK